MPTSHSDARRAVAICVPSSGRAVPFAWAMAFKHLEPPANLHGLYFNEIGKPHDVARNRLVETAREYKVRYIAMFDDDTVMPLNVLDQFVYQMENHPEIDVITGVYCSRTDPPAPMIFKPVNGAGSYWDWKLKDLFEIEGCGMGCVMMRPEAFDKIEKPWFLTTTSQARVGNTLVAEKWGEDIYFCKKLIEAGGRIFCDSSILCPHVDAQTNQVYVLPPDSKPYWNTALAPDPAIEIRAAAKIEGWMTLPELGWLARQAKAHRCIVEIGSYLGRSTRALADNTMGHVHAIDDWQGPRDAPVDRAGLLAKFEANMAGLNGRLKIHVADHRALEFPADEPVDMVFLDGSHEYEDVKRDIGFWRQRVANGCLISGHDFSSGWPGVRQAVTEAFPLGNVVANTSIWYAEIRK